MTSIGGGLLHDSTFVPRSGDLSQPTPVRVIPAQVSARA